MGAESWAYNLNLRVAGLERPFLTLVLACEGSTSSSAPIDSARPFFALPARFLRRVGPLVRYGHIISPQSDGAKIFCIFYFFLATATVGNLLGDLSSLQYDKLELQIRNTLIESVTWVHKADLGGRSKGTIFQSDYRKLRTGAQRSWLRRPCPAGCSSCTLLVLHLIFTSP